MRSGSVQFGTMERVIYGTAAAEALRSELDARRSQRVFLMASGTLNRETDEIQKVREAMGSRLAGEFYAMPAHTPRGAVIEASMQAKEAGADTIVTFGGGSVTDGAKAVALCLAAGIERAEDMDALRSPENITSTIPQITIPTTLSGGEFSALSGVTDERTKNKELFKHPSIMPKVAILDPAPTIHTPEWLFLSTGIRAVDHCVEGICSAESNPHGDAIALKGLSLLASGLPRVKADLGDLEARLQCQMGTWMSMAPLVGGVPMGASHGIGYVLGALFGVPHGHTSCIMLPAVMRWNKSHNADRQKLVAAAMGHPGSDAGEVLDRFISGLDMPRSLTSVEIPEDAYPQIAKQAMGTPWVPRNPRPIPGPEQVLEILEFAR